MLCWGLNIVMLKVLVQYIPPVSMQALRILIAGVVVLLFLFLTRQFKWVGKGKWKFILLAALFGVLGHHIFLALGLTLTTASNTSLILALLPLATSILAVIFLHDKLTKLRVVGLVLGLVGVMIIILFGGNSELSTVNIGDIFIFLSMAFQAVSFIFIKKATATTDSKIVTGMMLVSGSFLLFLFSFLLERNGLSSLADVPSFIWGVFFASAIIATAIGHLLFNYAIHKIGAGQTVVFNNFVPFFGLVSAAIFLGEKITIVQVLGFVVIIIAVLLGTGYVDEKRKERQQRQKIA